MKTKSDRIQSFILTVVFILILFLLLGYLIAWKPFRYTADEITEEVIKNDLQVIIDSQDRNRVPEYLLAEEGEDPPKIENLTVLVPAAEGNVRVYSGKMNLYGHETEEDTYFLTFYNRSPLNKKFRSTDGYLFSRETMENIPEEPVVLGGKSLFVIYRVDLTEPLPDAPLSLQEGGEYYTVRSATDRPILIIFVIIILFSFGLAFRRHRYQMDMVRNEAAEKKRRAAEAEAAKAEANPEEPEEKAGKPDNTSSSEE